MGAADKARNKAEELIGKGKETVGDITDNDKLQREGKADQVKAKAKQTGEDLKDGAEDLRDRVSKDEDEQDQR